MSTPARAVMIPAAGRSSQIEMWKPGTPGPTPTDRKWTLCFANCTDANHATV